jgi:hypothetical protein
MNSKIYKFEVVIKKFPTHRRRVCRIPIRKARAIRHDKGNPYKLLIQYLETSEAEKFIWPCPLLDLRPHS